MLNNLRFGSSVVVFLLATLVQPTSFGQTVHRDHSSEILTSQSLGSARVTMTRAALVRVLGGRLRIDSGQDPAGNCVVGYTDNRKGITYYLVKGRLSKINVEGQFESKIETVDGVKFGMSAGEVTSHFAGRYEKISDEAGAEDYEIVVRSQQKPQYAIGFYIEGGRVTWMSSGFYKEVRRLEGCL